MWIYVLLVFFFFFFSYRLKKKNSDRGLLSVHILLLEFLQNQSISFSAKITKRPTKKTKDLAALHGWLVICMTLKTKDLRNKNIQRI
jgi:hypothetical protein